MKKFLFVLMDVFVVIGAFAAGENVPTSKSYVDSKLGEKQDTIPANNGATQVLTNTGTAGEYGTKGIYDANGEYAAQTQNLVDAVAMNAGVQNAINSEFQCIEWLDPNDHSSDCLLMDVFGQTERRSPNLFDLETARIMPAGTDATYTKLSNGYRVTNGSVMLELGDIEDFIGKTLIYSVSHDCSGDHNVLLYQTDSNGMPIGVHYSNPTIFIRKLSTTVTKLALRLYSAGRTCTFTNIQVEEGTVATPYVPYGNIYMPTAE